MGSRRCAQHTPPHRQFSLRYDRSCSVRVSQRTARITTVAHQKSRRYMIDIEQKKSLEQQAAAELVCRRSEKETKKQDKGDMDAGGGTAVSVTVQQSSLAEVKPGADLGPVVAEPALQSLTIGRVKAPGNRPSRDFRKSMIPLEDPPEEEDEEDAKEKDTTVKTSLSPDGNPQLV